MRISSSPKPSTHTASSTMSVHCSIAPTVRAARSPTAAVTTSSNPASVSDETICSHSQRSRSSSAQRLVVRTQWFRLGPSIAKRAVRVALAPAPHRKRVEPQHRQERAPVLVARERAALVGDTLVLRELRVSHRRPSAPWLGSGTPRRGPCRAARRRGRRRRPTPSRCRRPGTPRARCAGTGDSRGSACG